MDPSISTFMLETLARLNQIGTSLIREEAADPESLKRTLHLIVESATELVPGVSATIYTFDPLQGGFEPGSRVSAGPLVNPEVDDLPRQDGMGRRAIELGSRVLSYQNPDLTIHPAKAALGAKVVACYPLRVAEENLGVLYVYRHDFNRFTELELFILEHFMQLTALTLSLARGRSLAQQEQAA